MNKKALASVLMYIIIAILATFIVWESFGGQFVNKLNKEQRRQVCFLSVEAKAKIKTAGFGTESPTTLNCETNYITVDSTGIYYSPTAAKKGDREINFRGMDKDQQEESIKKYVAEELKGCWQQFGQGKINFLGDYKFEAITHRCFPCAKVTFEEQFLRGFTYGDFEEYLSNSDLSSTQSYKQYLVGDEAIYTESYRKNNMVNKKGDALSIGFLAISSHFYKPDKTFDWTSTLFFPLWVKKNLHTQPYLIAVGESTSKCTQLY